jgi:riboflavin synthase
VAVADGDGYRRLSIALGDRPRAVVGASIAADGCCLTVEKTEGTVATFVRITETLKKTTLGTLGVGDPVNVEPSLLGRGTTSGAISSPVTSTGSGAWSAATRDPVRCG